MGVNARRVAGGLALVALVALAACSEANKQTYAQAAVGTVGAVAAVGVYRALTHDCWARCGPGYLCNQESGLCELGECLPGCEYGWHCMRDVRGYRCVSDSANQPVVSSVSSPPVVAAPAPLFDAGPAADSGLANSGPDASADAASVQ